jgi:hypothetical protein
MSRRRVLALAMFALPLVVVGVACTFPDVSFGPADDKDSGKDPSPDAASDAVADQELGDAVRREDGSLVGDPSICDTDARAKCDCDDDGFAATDCDAGVDATTLKSLDGSFLKLGDCDDLDALRHPGQTYVEDVPPPGKDGDWDCNGKIDYFPSQGITCNLGALGTCSGGPGFVTAPPCGTPADYYNACETRYEGLTPKCVLPPSGDVLTQTCK